MSKLISKSLAETISLSFQLGYAIALPLVVLAVFGRFLDRKWLTSPLFLLVSIGLAFIISLVLIYRKIKIIIKDSEKEK
ncbi:MAG: AtpZ/AtpI family protein [Candidatus Berkelbacteria bacterium]|nr:AtpZ/AtpI family protein [Candidatus Berkelbacteria bacterium]